MKYPNVILFSKQKKVIEFLRDGLTFDAIADRMSVSKTAAWRLSKRAQARLGVDSVKHAIQKLSKLQFPMSDV